MTISASQPSEPNLSLVAATMDDQLISLSKVIARLPDHVTVQGSIAEEQNAPRVLLMNVGGAARVLDVRNPDDLAALRQVLVQEETVVMDETGEFFFHSFRSFSIRSFTIHSFSCIYNSFIHSFIHSSSFRSSLQYAKCKRPTSAPLTFLACPWFLRR